MLIVKVDGIDGCGKSTLCDHLASRYATRFRVISTQEFGCSLDVLENGNSGIRSVSQLLLDVCRSGGDLDPLERKVLYLLMSRRTNRLVLPRLSAEYDIAFVDRSGFSSLAYVIEPHGSARKLYHLVAAEHAVSDIVFWIDTPVETCWRRLQARRSKRSVLDAIERLESIEYLRRAREGFKRLRRVQPLLFRLDGALELSNVVSCAEGAIDRLLG